MVHPYSHDRPVGWQGERYFAMVTTMEHTDLRAAVRDLSSQYGLEYWAENDRAHRFPTEFWRALGRSGWHGTAIPVEYGGAGLGLVALAGVVEEASRAGGGATVSQLFMLTPIFGGVSIEKHGTSEQKARFLPQIARGEADFCLALTEPNAGSDTLATTTVAIEAADGYHISGQKIWITGVDQADWMIIVARTTPVSSVPKRTIGLSLFLVDAKDPRITYHAIEKAGTNCIGSFAVFFDDLVVPKDALLGERDRGWYHLLATLNSERIVSAAGCLATADLALQIATEHARTRRVFGAAIGAYQGIQFPLAEAKIDTELARLMTYKAASLYDEGLECGAEANIAKLAAARAGLAAADRAIQTLGGMGYARESHVERLWRDARLFGFAPVSEELILAYVAHSILGLPKSY
jgi:acyl-CoA dehydrogenase